MIKTTINLGVHISINPLEKLITIVKHKPVIVKYQPLTILIEDDDYFDLCLFNTYSQHFFKQHKIIE
jgi:hypothetical protein